MCYYYRSDEKKRLSSTKTVSFSNPVAKVKQLMTICVSKKAIISNKKGCFFIWSYFRKDKDRHFIDMLRVLNATDLPAHPDSVHSVHSVLGVLAPNCGHGLNLGYYFANNKLFNAQDSDNLAIGFPLSSNSLTFCPRVYQSYGHNHAGSS